MIKIAHEAPINIFNKVEEYTDYSYALVHLFEENEEYLNLFVDALAKGREVILDNSIFELEEAFDADKFASWVEELEPTWYIVPDSLENIDKTVRNMEDWNNAYGAFPNSKKIGVVQGKTYSEIVECYEYMANVAQVDMIAISFDYSYFERTFTNSNKYISWMLGRINLLNRMMRDGVIDREVPHHLLGCGLPQEFSFYNFPEYDFIYSLDTSNPVVHGIKNITYQPQGLWNKESQKLFELINYNPSSEQIGNIIYNIRKFRSLTNGQQHF